MPVNFALKQRIFFKNMLRYVILLHSALLCVFLIPEQITAGDFSIQKLISDTLEITIQIDSSAVDQNALTVLDLRPNDGTHLVVTQINRYLYIPVDRFVVLNLPLASIMGVKLHSPLPGSNMILSVNHLNIWMDKGPLFARRWKLNAQTNLQFGDPVKTVTWNWDIRLPRDRTLKDLDQKFFRLLELWLQALQIKLDNTDFETATSGPIPNYKRQLDTWCDLVVFPDGNSINTRLLLEYPEDQLTRWIRGNPGIYYSRFIRYESVAIGGLEQMWYRRLSANSVSRYGMTGRLGFNSFNPDYFDHVEWHNIFLVQLSAQISLDYYLGENQRYYLGIGIFQSGNILPDNVPRFNTGVSGCMGIKLK